MDDAMLCECHMSYSKVIFWEEKMVKWFIFYKFGHMDIKMYCQVQPQLMGAWKIRWIEIPKSKIIDIAIHWISYLLQPNFLRDIWLAKVKKVHISTKLLRRFIFWRIGLKAILWMFQRQFFYRNKNLQCKWNTFLSPFSICVLVTNFMYVTFSQNKGFQ